MVHAQGPLGPVFDLEPWVVGLIAFGLVAILYAIEVLRSIFDSRRRPPYGLAIFRFNTNWLGDTLGLSMAAGGIAAFYQQDHPAFPGWVESTVLTAIAIVTAVAISIGFIAMEELTHAYTSRQHKPADHWNANRIYHFVYFGLMVFILATAGLRIFGGIHGANLAVSIALCGFIIWGWTLFLDVLGVENPMWGAVKKRWPERTRVM